MSTSTIKPSNESGLGTKQARYLFTTKYGTELSKFKEYIKTLPDKGEGEQDVFPRVPFQSYVTTLTYAQAKDVQNQSFIAYVVLAGESKDREFVGDSNTSRSSSEQSSNGVQNLQARLTSDQHLRLISTKEQDMKDGRLPNYLFDPQLGNGQTIYILDSGFNVEHEEFGGDRSIETKVVPNWLTLEDVPNPSHWWPEDDIADYTGHGTLAASIAAGRTHGVASRANLVLVKFKQRAYNPKSENWPFRGVTNRALSWAWTWILADALGKRANGHSGQFIVNMNCGFEYRPTEAQRFGNGKDRVMEAMLFACWANDIITVVPTGNGGADGESLDEHTPQNLGTAQNGMITVGGVDNYGVLAPRTTFNGGRGGSITVYAVSENVVGASRTGKSGTAVDSGTSLAAPAVAGLAAYFASLPYLAHEWGERCTISWPMRTSEWTERCLATTMKRYITRYATQRTPNSIPKSLPAPYQRPLGPINVIYNRASENFCYATLPLKHSNFVATGTHPNQGQEQSRDVDVLVSGKLVVTDINQLYQ